MYAGTAMKNKFFISISLICLLLMPGCSKNTKSTYTTYLPAQTITKTETSWTTITSSAEISRITTYIPVTSFVTTTTTSTVTALPVNAKNRVAILGGESKFKSYISQAGYALTDMNEDQLPTQLKTDSFGGVWITAWYDLTDEQVFAVSQFVNNGGKVFWETTDYNLSHISKALNKYFAIVTAFEEVKMTYQPYYYNGLGLFPDLKVGFDNASLYAFFGSHADYYQGAAVISEATKLPREVELRGKIGKGEIYIVLTPAPNALYNSWFLETWSITDNRFIDTCNNKEGAIRIVKWLSNQ
jgi:hypothetical protein